MLLRLSICLIFVGMPQKPFLADSESRTKLFVAGDQSGIAGAPTLGVIGSDIAAAHPLARLSEHASCPLIVATGSALLGSFWA